MNNIQVAQECAGRATGGGGPQVDGKYLRVDGERFYVRGMTYGTFAETELGLFPGLKRVEEDFAAMAAVGINTVRTYTVPGLEILELAEEAGLKLLMGVWWDDPRYLNPTDRGSWQKMAAEARTAVKEAVESYAGHPAILGFVLGNEIPGPVVRWHGRRRIEGLLRSLQETGKDAAQEAHFSYANYPTTQYLDTSYFDFDCFNVFLEEESAYRRPSGRRSRLAGTGRDGVGACGDLYLLMDRRLVGRGTQGRGLVFRRNPREPGAQTSPEGFGRLLREEAVGTARGVAESLRGRLRLPGARLHRGMPVVFDRVRLSQLRGSSSGRRVHGRDGTDRP
jgi:hypothetical protein